MNSHAHSAHQLAGLKIQTLVLKIISPFAEAQQELGLPAVARHKVKNVHKPCSLREVEQTRAPLRAERSAEALKTTTYPCIWSSYAVRSKQGYFLF